MRFWLQYHSYNNLGYLPGGYETNIDDLSTLDTSKFDLSCVTTAKSAIRNAINDVVFLIVGYGKSPKKYVLWSWFIIDEVEEIPGIEFNAFGKGEVLNPLPLLTGKEFDEFKRKMANFSLGFINISNRPYTQHLIELAVEFQQDRHKRRLNEFWSNRLENQNELAELRDERQRIEAEGYFNVENLEDARRRVTASIVQRQGQSEFRRKLLTAYGGRCAISGCDAEPAIEAAHILPYQGTQTNHITNGLPLRADIHTLFDLYLLSVQPDTHEIIVAPELMETCYQEFSRQKLTLPKDTFALPSSSALGKHYENFLQKHNRGA